MQTLFGSSLRLSRLFLALFFSCIVFASGCGDRVAVTGKITFPDGTPLTSGSIVFETDNYQGYSYIDSEGFYSLGESESGGKIKTGEYKIKILATTGGDSSGEPLVNLVDPKYASTATSELTCTVKGKMEHNITVEKP